MDKHSVSDHALVIVFIVVSSRAISALRSKAAVERLDRASSRGCFSQQRFWFDYCAGVWLFLLEGKPLTTTSANLDAGPEPGEAGGGPTRGHDVGNGQQSGAPPGPGIPSLLGVDARRQESRKDQGRQSDSERGRLDDRDPRGARMAGKLASLRPHRGSVSALVWVLLSLQRIAYMVRALCCIWCLAPPAFEQGGVAAWRGALWSRRLLRRNPILVAGPAAAFSAGAVWLCAGGNVVAGLSVSRPGHRCAWTLRKRENIRSVVLVASEGGVTYGPGTTLARGEGDWRPSGDQARRDRLPRQHPGSRREISAILRDDVRHILINHGDVVLVKKRSTPSCRRPSYRYTPRGICWRR